MSITSLAHVLDGGGIQHAAPLEEAENAALEERLEVMGIVACEVCGLVEARFGAE